MGDPFNFFETNDEAISPDGKGDCFAWLVMDDRLLDNEDYLNMLANPNNDVVHSGYSPKLINNAKDINATIIMMNEMIHILAHIPYFPVSRLVISM